MKLPLKEFIILSIVAAVAAFAGNYISPVGIALVGDWDTSKGVISAKSKTDIVDHDVEVNDVHKVKKLYDTGLMLFVDARTETDFNLGHIKNAVNIPVNEFFDKMDWFLTNFHDPETPIITYCSGRECEDSHKLASLLKDVGYSRVKVFIDGFPAWDKEGFPVEK